MKIIQQFVEPIGACMYLPEQQATLRYQIAAQISPAEYEARMNQGWRKFGAALFAPVCASCASCRPLRVDANAFTPDRSQRRVLRDNADLQVVYAAPQVDAARLDLYARYHQAQHARKGWPDHDRSPSTQAARDYVAQFVHNPLPAVEISVWETVEREEERGKRKEEELSSWTQAVGDEGSLSSFLFPLSSSLVNARLLGVLLGDLTPNTLSGVYHYHDPDYRERSLGTFLILQSLALARNSGKPWVYMGYHVQGCSSMMYKSRYRPCEILHPDGVWRAMEAHPGRV